MRSSLKSRASWAWHGTAWRNGRSALFQLTSSPHGQAAGPIRPGHRQMRLSTRPFLQMLLMGSIAGRSAWIISCAQSLKSVRWPSSSAVSSHPTGLPIPSSVYGKSPNSAKKNRRDHSGCRTVGSIQKTAAQSTVNFLTSDYILYGR
jgi:hypothetical protein